MDSQDKLRETIQERLAESVALHERLAGMGQTTTQILKAAEVLIAAYRSGHKAIFFGNGGSAADAQHLAAEFLGRFMRERAALPAVALVANPSVLTAIGNDYGFDRVFARQIEGIGVGGDVAVGISTSGNSPNVIAAVKQAKQQGIQTIGLTGATGGQLRKEADVPIEVPSLEVPRIQEGHILIGHILCELVERYAS
jgi:D-sedoheptulose 7-phosphate isomerase